MITLLISPSSNLRPYLHYSLLDCSPINFSVLVNLIVLITLEKMVEFCCLCFFCQSETPGLFFMKKSKREFELGSPEVWLSLGTPDEFMGLAYLIDDTIRSGVNMQKRKYLPVHYSASNH